MTTSAPATVVIGVGNEFRGDDGAGIAVARCLRERLSDEVRIIEESGEGIALMDAWRGAMRAILIDAVQSGAAPGTVHRINASAGPVPSGLFPCSTHAFGIAEAIEVARALHELPMQLIVYGIEGANFDEVKSLSPAVEHAVGAVADQIVNQLGAARRII